MVILIREPLTDLVETKDLGTLTELEACLAGQVLVPNQQLQAFTPAPAGTQTAIWRVNSPCGKLMKASRRRWCTDPGRSSTARWRRSTRSRRRSRAAQQAVTGARRPRLQAGARQGHVEAAGGSRGERRRTARQPAAVRAADPDVPRTRGSRGSPTIDDPQFIPADRFRPDARRQPAQGPLRVPVPDQELGADPGPPEGVAERRSAGRGDLAGSARRSRCRCSARPTAAPTRCPACRW